MKWNWSSDATLASNRGEGGTEAWRLFHYQVEVKFFNVELGFCYKQFDHELENCLKRLCCR